MIETRADLKAIEARFGGVLEAVVADPDFAAQTLVVVAQDPDVPPELVAALREVHQAHERGDRPRLVFADGTVIEAPGS